MRRNLRSALTPTLALGCVVACALGLGLPSCATAQKAYIPDEGGEGGFEEEGGIDPDGGGSEGGEGGAQLARVACGSTFCRSDQICVQGACKFECTGTQVPGDYATITSAVTALAATGADISICLGAVQAGESASITDPKAQQKTVKVTATSPLQTTLGSVSVGAGFSAVTLIGFGTSSNVSVTGGGKVTLRALRLGSTTSTALQVRPVVGTALSSVLVDGCDIGSAGTNGYGVYVDNTALATVDVSIVNSYIHGGLYGVYMTGTGNSQLGLSLLNNTIDKAQHGIYLAGGASTPVKYVNNIISNSIIDGITLSATMTSVTHSNNALFGNASHYAGSAVDGAMYVKADCQLDTATGVPQTRAGSPCRGAGKTEGAPPTDYWHASRGASVDIGAVQGP